MAKEDQQTNKSTQDNIEKLKTEQQEPYQKLVVISGTHTEKQILLHICHSSCYSYDYKLGNK